MSADSDTFFITFKLMLFHDNIIRGFSQPVRRVKAFANLLCKTDEEKSLPSKELHSTYVDVLFTKESMEQPCFT